jgi:hypothetical protein
MLLAQLDRTSRLRKAPKRFGGVEEYEKYYGHTKRPAKATAALRPVVRPFAGPAQAIQAAQSKKPFQLKVITLLMYPIRDSLSDQSPDFGLSATPGIPPFGSVLTNEIAQNQQKSNAISTFGRDISRRRVIGSSVLGSANQGRSVLSARQSLSDSVSSLYFF